ncbi:hypothetical protein BLNAU_23873 [Blattamonas nauphoetae]|uniref:Uncharacterized protein n=1 Tax=Blattamonas nauphoetae TaxID=2049346 RepID=A0ABQ9WNZ7_9EUKA|nr:hypothetical protein BLNAU_23873 [Blattamonas nauphoetae]
MQRISIAAIVEMETSGWIGTGEGFIVLFAINNNVLHSQLDLSTSTGVANYNTALGIRDDVEEDEFGLFEKGEPMRVDLHGLTTTLSQVRYPSEWKETKREGVSTLTARDDQTKRTIEGHEEEPYWDHDGREFGADDEGEGGQPCCLAGAGTRRRSGRRGTVRRPDRDAVQPNCTPPFLSPLHPRPSLIPPSKPHTSFPLNLPTEEPVALHPKRHSSPQLSARNGFSPRRNSAIQSPSRSIPHADDVATVRSLQSSSFESSSTAPGESMSVRGLARMEMIWSV